MIPISAALKAHFQQAYQTTSTCWLVQLVSGTVLGFTDHDQIITFNLESWMTGFGIPANLPGIQGTGSVAYSAVAGYTKTDIASSGALNVDNLEVDGILVSPSISEADLRAGLWDFAHVTIFTVNWADLTQGALVQRCGTLGEVTIERGAFKAKLRGVTQAYSRVIIELTTPSCRAKLGDSRCTVDLTPFTVTGTLTGVEAGAYPRTLYDTSRTEPGPSAGVSITGITTANPGHVTLAAPLGLPSGSPITIAGVVGMVEVNTVTVAENVASDGLSFDLPVDTSTFPSWVSGGTVIGLGSGSGYFDNGVITFTSGLNTGLSMEVQSYVPGQWTLELPMPYLPAIGDTYSMHAGCDYSLETCRDRFSNLVNMRAEPYVPGVDKLVQIGKQGG
jgi:hypothetical protein